MMKMLSGTSLRHSGEVQSAGALGRRRLLGGAGGLIASAVLSGERLHARMPLLPATNGGCATGPREMPGLEFVLQAHVTVAPGIELGRSGQGDRRIVPITGGTFQGERLSGTVLAEGEDTQVLRPDGVREITARYVLRTNDDVRIYVVNSGLIVPQDSGGLYKRTTPRFDAPSGSRYSWLNRAVFVGTLHRLPTREHAVLVRFFKVT